MLLEMPSTIKQLSLILSLAPSKNFPYYRSKFYTKDLGLPHSIFPQILGLELDLQRHSSLRSGQSITLSQNLEIEMTWEGAVRHLKHRTSAKSDKTMQWLEFVSENNLNFLTLTPISVAETFVHSCLILNVKLFEIHKDIYSILTFTAVNCIVANILFW